MNLPGTDFWSLATGIASLVFALAIWLIPRVNNRYFPAKRSTPNGAWERVARVSEIAAHPTSTELDWVLKGSVEAAIRVDAFTETKAPVAVPYIGAAAMLLITGTSITVGVAEENSIVTWDNVLFLAGCVAYLWLAASNTLKNESKRQSINALVAKGDQRLLTDPWKAIEDYESTTDHAQSWDALLLLKTHKLIKRKRLRLQAEQIRWVLLRPTLLMAAMRAKNLTATVRELKVENKRLRRKGNDDGTAGGAPSAAAE